MKKSIYTILTASALIWTLTGCGGSGGEANGTPSTQTRDTLYRGDIALWNYLVPSSDSTNTYIKTNGSDEKRYTTRFVAQNDSVTEISELSSNEKTVYTNAGNTIKITFYNDNVPNGSLELKSKVNLNDIVTVKKSDCRLKKHLETFTYDKHTYKDVIEIECGNTPGYYQKGVGEIMQKKALSANGAVETKILESRGK